MLRLPDNWQEICESVLVRQMLAEAGDGNSQTQVSRGLIWAHFDLLRRTLWRKDPPDIREGPPLTWRVGESIQIYLPCIDDDILKGDAYWRKQIGRVKLIVPPGMSRLVRCAVEHADGRIGRYAFISLGDLIELRVLFTMGDTGWSEVKVKRELLAAFNRFTPPDLRVVIDQRSST